MDGTSLMSRHGTILGLLKRRLSGRLNNGPLLMQKGPVIIGSVLLDRLKKD